MVRTKQFVAEKRRRDFGNKYGKKPVAATRTDGGKNHSATSTAGAIWKAATRARIYVTETCKQMTCQHYETKTVAESHPSLATTEFGC